MKNNFSNFFDRLRGKDQETQVVVTPEIAPEPVVSTPVVTPAVETEPSAEEVDLYGEDVKAIRALLEQLVGIEAELLASSKKHH
jgi:hypothetical protein